MPDREKAYPTFPTEADQVEADRRWDAARQAARREAHMLVIDACRQALTLMEEYDGLYSQDMLEHVLSEVIASMRAARRRDQPKPKRKLGHGKKRRIMERDEYRCKHCGTHRDLSVDHVIAEANGGTDEDDNLQTLCRSCNSRKGTR